jgi:hypothetical protein
MGLIDIVRSKVVDEAGMALVDTHNTCKAIVVANKSGVGAQSASSEYEIMRGDLVRILHDATKDNVEYLALPLSVSSNAKITSKYTSLMAGLIHTTCWLERTVKDLAFDKLFYHLTLQTLIDDWEYISHTGFCLVPRSTITFSKPTTVPVADWS